MSLSDEIAELVKLHESGALNDAEFELAKTKVLSEMPNDDIASGGTSGRPKPSRKARNPYRGCALVLLAIGLALWIFAEFRSGSSLHKAVKQVTRKSVVLMDSIENLGAGSWRALPLIIESSGKIEVELTVLRGNKIAVDITNQAGIDALKANKEFTVYSGYSARDTAAYKKTFATPSMQDSQQIYYLVLRDPTLGVLSHSTSDISVKATYHP